MFHSTFRRVPEAFYRIRTLKGVCGYSLIWSQGVSPRVEKKMVSEHFTGLKWALKTHKLTLLAAFFLPKPKLNTLRPYTCAELHIYIFSSAYCAHTKSTPNSACYCYLLFISGVTKLWRFIDQTQHRSCKYWTSQTPKQYFAWKGEDNI